MPEKYRIKPESYKNHSEKFKPPATNFTTQYFPIYKARLEKMRPLLIARVQNQWHALHPICANLGDIRMYTIPCIVFGTIYKEQKLKPSVLNELSEENQLIPQPILHHFTDDADQLILEDELQRITLSGADVHSLVTGIPCAILGVADGIGKFNVDTIIFAGVEPIERPLIDNDRFVVLISGIDISNKNTSLLTLDLFIDWLGGMFMNEPGTDPVPSRISRVIIAGNSIRAANKIHTAQTFASKMTAKCDEQTDLIESVKLFDATLERIVAHCHVDVLPGEFDPSNYMMPQQPLHHCMLPRASAYKTLTTATNPYDCEIDGVHVMGSAGKPVKDILAFSRLESPLDALERTLEWAHLCPTAPDTLASFPFYETDPFIIDRCPHVLFAGNQETFNSRVVAGTRLIIVPRFSTTGTVVLLNLKDLTCKSVSFKVDC